MKTGNHHDGIDNQAWGRIAVLVGAARRGDRSAFESEIRSWRTEISVTEQQRMGLYLLAGIKYSIRRILAGEPSESDLRILAARSFPDVSKVLPAQVRAVEDTLRAAFGLRAIKRELSPGELVVISAAVIGCLLTDHSDELKEMRTYVAEWWRVNAPAIHGRGVSDS